VRIPNSALRFRPGAPSLATLLHVRALPAVTAPDDRLIWRVENGTALPLVVQAGVSDGTYSELASGPLEPGDLLVVEMQAGDKRAP
jgi:hypothetical protein